MKIASKILKLSGIFGMTVIITIGLSFSGFQLNTCVVKVYASESIALEPTIRIGNNAPMTRNEFLAWSNQRRIRHFSIDGRIYPACIFFDGNTGLSFDYGTSNERILTVLLHPGVASRSRRTDPQPLVAASVLSPASSQFNLTSITPANENKADTKDDFWAEIPSEVVEVMRSGATTRKMLEMFPDIDIQSLFEQEVIRIVNEIRADHGLLPLTYSPELARIARLRAQESLDYGYIRGHISQTTGLAHTDHARSMGLDVRYAGEIWAPGTGSGSMARGFTVNGSACPVNTWMASPDHRAFILSGLDGNDFGSDLVYIGAGFAFDHYPDSITRLGTWTLWQMVTPEG